LSEVLTDSALADDVEVTSVEDPAPASEGEVVEESAKGVDSVPAARFNGLMGKFHQTQSALEEAQARVAELESRSAQSESDVEDRVPDNAAELLDEVAQLRAELRQERLDSARAKALNDYPEVRPFADLIVANTPEDVKELAREISERMKTAGVTTAPVVEQVGDTDSQVGDVVVPAGEATTEEQTAPVVGGGTVFSGDGHQDESVTKAIESGDFAGFLAARRQQASAHGELELV
jgi:uncharacterized coiled-coil protein SlyX